jgi:hypothetical protein
MTNTNTDAAVALANARIAMTAATDAYHAAPNDAAALDALTDAANDLHVAYVAMHGVGTTDPDALALLSELDADDRARIDASGVTVELDGSTVTFRLGRLTESMSPDGYVDTSGELFTVDDIMAWDDMVRTVYFMDNDTLTSLVTLIHVGSLV